ncbi:MAG: UDP-N-acetylmuramoyl-L-alanyl-D-glutamate--2,6-diaminopimelate ligase [Rhodanobacteraceae bacterium]
MSAVMTLDGLLSGVADAGDAGNMTINGLCLDSRRVRQGEAFVALSGHQHHGIEFAASARDKGAVMVLAEAPEPENHADGGPTVWINDLSARLGDLAARFFAHPGEAMRITGVTGTNGKTSVVQLLAQAWSCLGHVAASIGTLGAGLHGALGSGERTTPDAISVQALLADFREQGVQEVLMEVSSHALVQGRVNGVPIHLAVFTNLSRDHLDYHGSMQAYAEAKARLFDWPTLETAVINIDDAFGRELAARLPERQRRLTVAIEETTADLRAVNLRSHADGFDFDLVSPWGRAHVHTPLLGRFNVANLLAVAACLGACGVGFAELCGVLGKLQPIAGRMNRIGGSGLPLVVVDYAHTPQALEVALQSLRPHTRGGLVCVFGAGGERDAGKRPQMAAVVESLADRMIITDDNPRAEDGDAIVADILAGLNDGAAVQVMRERKEAIASAIRGATSDDVVLIAGKGHETTQEDAHGKHPFNDLDVAAQALQGRTSC